MSTAICPICSKTFLQSKLETHVNKCLDGDGDSDVPFEVAANTGDNNIDKDLELARRLQEEFGNEKSEIKSDKITGNKRSADAMTDEEFARMLAEEENQSVSSTTSGSISCQLCSKKFSIDDIYILDECSHKYCKSCIRSYVENKIATDIKIGCPLKECGKELSVRDTKEFLPKKQKTSHGGGGLVPKNSSGKATERLYAELTHLLKGEPDKQGYSVEPIDDNIYHWEITFFNFDKSEPLAKDMKKMGVDSILLHVTFPSSFPFAPPFIRVIRPRFVYRTGHVTIGGSICTELLTNKGWSPAITMESVIVTIRAQLCEGGARLDFTNKRDYSEAEAKDAFQRMAHTHGWL